MRKYIFTLSAIILLAAGCGKHPAAQQNQQINNSPEQQADKTIGWKTYTNSRYGFEFKYPKEYTLKDTGAIVIIDDPSISSGPNAALDYHVVMINSQTTDKTLSEFINARNDGNDLSQARAVTVNGIAAYEAVSVGMTSSYSVFVKNSSYLISIGFDAGNDGGLEKNKAALTENQKLILSSFKLITPQMASFLYKNTQYGFTFALPESWKGYSVLTQISGGWSWQATDINNSQKVVAQGPAIVIRNPEWTSQKPYQDIPILIFTLQQWNDIQDNKIMFSTAAPILPGELGRNAKYVFALPARYNFAEVEGIQEVDGIIQTQPLNGF